MSSHRRPKKRRLSGSGVAKSRGLDRKASHVGTHACRQALSTCNNTDCFQARQFCFLASHSAVTLSHVCRQALCTSTSTDCFQPWQICSLAFRSLVSLSPAAAWARESALSLASSCPHLVAVGHATCMPSVRRTNQRQRPGLLQLAGLPC